MNQKHLDEQKEEEKNTGMAMHDRPALLQFEEETKQKQVSFSDVVEVEEDEQPKTPVEQGQESPKGARPSSCSAAAAAAMPSTPVPMAIFSDNDGEIPPTTPGATATTRTHGDDADDHESKRARVETSKKQSGACG